ncbi:hypothetical protein [Vibrio sp. R78045]|uniref:hypothetical protein n=1 Tax=Vibrio sp. R78045 TaxID=3093868 RepID=UPI0036F1AD5D
MEFFNLDSHQSSLAREAYDLSETLITELMDILCAGFCIQIGLSGGKDSSTVTNASVEAMRRCIESGLIERSRPLVVITVDTLLEPASVQMYLPVVHADIQSKCDEHGINLHLEMVSPPIHQQLMILFAGTQKLFASAASGRNADCSVVFKIDTARKSLAKIKSSLPSHYKSSPWVSISGSRTEESQRRHMNMVKQNVANRDSQNLIDELKRDGMKSSGKVYKFAPIGHWTTPEVINYLNHAGSNPVARTIPNQRISAYSKSFGLLLAIYGEGSNDACDLNSGSDGAANGCNGTARFGCITCGLVKVDHSGEQMQQYPRWSRFGDASLRLRDFFIRTSLDVKYRAYHPRAICSTTSNVYLQPNVLKARTLEKLVYFGAQISEDSKAVHDEFNKCLESGDVDSDIGVQDIMNDPTLSSDVKEEYKNAYIARLSEKPMYELFSKKHAVLLSYLWVLHGVDTAPYRPIAILNNVIQGKRIPYPKTNNEINALRTAQGMLPWDHKDVINTEIPEARLYQLFTPPVTSFSELKATHGDDLSEAHLSQLLPINLTDYWKEHNKPFVFDSMGIKLSRLSSQPLRTRKIKVAYSHCPKTNVETLKTTCVATNKVLKFEKGSPAYIEIMELVQAKMDAALEMEAKKHNGSVEGLKEEYSTSSETFEVTGQISQQYCSIFKSRYLGVNTKARKAPESTLRFSRRKRTATKSGQFQVGRSSLKDYTPRLTTKLSSMYERSIQYWLPDLQQITAYQFDVANYSTADVEFSVKQPSFSFTNQFEDWVNVGWNELVLEHDLFIQESKRLGLHARRYSGTEPCHKLLQCTGLTISPDFAQYIQTTLARTETFESCKLHSLASRTPEQIDQAYGVISMAEHRSQKANQLLAVRFIRSQTRREIFQLTSLKNAELRGHSLSVAALRLNEFLGHYVECTESLLALKLVNAVNKKENALIESLEMWLREFSPILTSPKKAISLLLTDHELESINDDFDAVKLFSESYARQVSDCVDHIEYLFSSKEKEIGHLQSLCRKKENIFEDDLKNLEVVDDSQFMEFGGWLKSRKAAGNAYLIAHGLLKILAYSYGHYASQSVSVECLNRVKTVYHTLDFKCHSVKYSLQNRSVTATCISLLSPTAKANKAARLSEKKANELSKLRQLANV